MQGEQKAQASQSLIKKCDPGIWGFGGLGNRHESKGGFMDSQSLAMKREHGDDEVEGTAKQARCVKEEGSTEATVPKVDGSVDASPSASIVPWRRRDPIAQSPSENFVGARFP